MNNLEIREDKLTDRLFAKFGMSVTYISGYSGYYEDCLFTCSVHGDFLASPRMVLRNELGCSKCGLAKMSLTKSTKDRKFENTISDLDPRLFEDVVRFTKIKDLWSHMLQRCYGNKVNNSTYKDCSVSQDWLRCSKFFEDIRQFENYEMIHKGWQLDKDILVKGNRVYSKETCCIVPQAINSIITKSPKKSTNLPVGVRQRCDGKGYCAQLNLNSSNKKVHLGSFDNINEAFLAYKEAKETSIAEVAEVYKVNLTKETYNALKSFKVEITD